MIRHIVLLIIGITILLIHCRSGKHSSDNSSPKNITSEIHSANTKMFLNDLDKEDPDNPGKKFLEKYAITTIDERHYVGAILNIDRNLDTSCLTDKGVLTGNEKKGKLTARIPLDQIADLHEIPGILYIDIDRKVSLRQK